MSFPGHACEFDGVEPGGFFLVAPEQKTVKTGSADHVVVGRGQAVDVDIEFFADVGVEFVRETCVRFGVDVVQYMIPVLPHVP
jgi:hypothetical protein